MCCLTLSVSVLKELLALLQRIEQRQGPLGKQKHILSLLFLFQQFEKGVVDICFEVLDNSPAALNNSEMDLTSRADPVYVSRIITAMVS